MLKLFFMALAAGLVRNSYAAPTLISEADRHPSVCLSLAVKPTFVGSARCKAGVTIVELYIGVSGGTGSR